MVGRGPGPREQREPSFPRDPKTGQAQRNLPGQGVQTEETLLDIARRLLEHETAVRQGAGESIEPSERVSQVLRSHLGRMMGASGFRFLMVRAAGSAGASFELNVDEDGNLKVLNTPGGTYNPAFVAATLANFFRLLGDIIGDNLVLRMIHQAWPDFDLLPPFSKEPKR